jgi:hypothetical protein
LGGKRVCETAAKDAGAAGQHHHLSAQAEIRRRDYLQLLPKAAAIAAAMAWLPAAL